MNRPSRWQRETAAAASTICGRAGAVLITITVVVGTRIEHLTPGLIDGAVGVTGLVLVGAAQGLSKRGR